MPVFIIETPDLFPDGSRKRMYVETYHPTLESLASDLRGGPVAVCQLFAKLHGEEMVVRDRRPLLISQHIVVTAHEPDRTFVEYEDPPSNG